MKKIVDTHAHLDHCEDLSRVLTQASEAGVEGIVTVSQDLESCKKNYTIKQSTKTPQIYLAMGIHPSEADKASLEACLQLAREKAQDLHAIGEIGLDFWYKWVRKDKEKKDQQRKVFREFLILAKGLDLPAIIHSRGTWRECLETAKEIGVKRAVFHWYSGPLDVLKDIIAEGYFVSTTPSVAYSEQLREAMGQAPIEQILIETDCPVFYKDRNSDKEGFISQPKDVFRTLSAYCELKQIDEATALETFNRNAKLFFNIQ